MLIAFGVITLSLSAQSKVAYCDVYVRGGGQNLRVTVMYNNYVHHFKRANMGGILNAFAAEGWALDSEIVIPRFHWWSWCTRHKLHLIMKKEYQAGENPFKNLSSLRFNKTNLTATTATEEKPAQNKSIGTIYSTQKHTEPLSLYGLYKDDAVIVELSEDGKHGKAIKTFNTVSSYRNAQLKCQEFEIGAGWRLPNVVEMLSIMKNRDAINKTLKAENLILISSKYNYWCYATVPTKINAKTLQTETCSNKNIAYDFIAILDF